jgi:hypothetical protein
MKAYDRHQEKRWDLWLHTKITAVTMHTSKHLYSILFIIYAICLSILHTGYLYVLYDPQKV